MRRPLLVLILALAIAPYLTGLGWSSLWDSNEAFYAETPRRMIETGDYINPSFNDRPRFNKPPLSYWVVASFYKVFGVSEATERLPIALGAIVLIGVAFLIGRIAFSTEAGLLAGLALALSPRFLMFSRRIIIDVYLAMFMGLTLMFFMLAERGSRRRRLYLALMYASAGLGFLTKGPVAILLPAIVFLLYLIITRQTGALRSLMLPAGALIIAAIVAPWYAAIYLEHGWVYIESFFLKDNLSRYTEPVWGPRRGLFFYVPVMIGDMFPWSFFLIPALFKRKAGEEWPDAVCTGRARPRLLLILWIAVIVVFFSFSSNKEDLYILPIYSAAAALAGGFLSALISGSEPGHFRAGRWATVAIGAVILLGGAAIIRLFDSGSTGYRLGGARAIGYLALAGGAAAVLLSLTRRVFPALAATGITFLVINWVFVLWTLPDFERYKPVRRFSELIKREASRDAMVGYYRFASPSMVFYLGRPIFEYYSEDELKSAFASGREVYCIMTAQDYEAIRESLPGRTNILASNPVFQVKLRFILESREPS
ncbi:MAG TPA: glycosyltransferase family 39 protein, partial [Blastocatellia bacterium]|nr:glycosyltransferase family 39 protein [Blastocatellia bacterium]